MRPGSFRVSFIAASSDRRDLASINFDGISRKTPAGKGNRRLCPLDACSARGSDAEDWKPRFSFVRLKKVSLFDRNI